MGTDEGRSRRWSRREVLGALTAGGLMLAPPRRVRAAEADAAGTADEEPDRDDADEGDEGGDAAEDEAADEGGGSAEASSDADGGSPASIGERPIPRTDETIPMVGLGTWQTFDVGDAKEARGPLVEVLERFFARGGRVIDTSPMYGAAESVLGDLLAKLDRTEETFLATKVWTRGEQDGIRQMEASMEKLHADGLDLMQVHNLVDTRTHLDTLRGWKREGRIRYLGVTHYQQSAFDDLERLIEEAELDFVQLPYSLVTREAEERLLPAAKAHDTAVLVMRPFEGGSLFQRVEGRELPEWAREELGVEAWSQFLLKWILGHEAVTCPIPGTSDPDHLVENMDAGTGPLPDAAMRRRMRQHLEG